MRLRIDLHVHTSHSKDATTTIKDLVLYSKRRGLDGVAITDHDTTYSPEENSEAEGLILIPGVEVTTTNGHILGLNVTTSIPKGLGVLETVERIHEAEGVAVATHPGAVFRKSLGSGILRGVTRIDALEVINSSTFPFFLSTWQNRRLASLLQLPQTAGSDSHIPETIGLAYTIVDAEPDLCSIVGAIKSGSTTPYGYATPIRLRLRNISERKKVGKKPF